MSILLNQIPRDIRDLLEAKSPLAEQYGPPDLWPEEDLRVVVCQHLGIPVLNISADSVDLDAFDAFRDLCLRLRVLPTYQNKIVLHVMSPCPWDEGMKRELRRASYKELRFVGCLEAAFDLATAEVEARLQARLQARSLVPPPPPVTPAEHWVITDSFTDLAKQIVHNAQATGATDFQIEPQENQVNIRFSYGEYEVMPPIEARYCRSLVKAFKDAAGLSDLSELAFQSGKARYVVNGQPIDVRLEISPSVWGDGISGRILESRKFNQSTELPFHGDTLAVVNHCLGQKQGIILVVGPTGSGKTTTLYKFIKSLDSAGKAIRTVEDPPEYTMDNVYQIEVGEKVKRTFAQGLKSLMRQDPDVILVGEIRDAEVAHIAIEAALTGHLVFASLHANDSPGAVPRLLEMGIPPFLLQSTLLVTVAQRLVPLLCENCRCTEEVIPPQCADHFAMYGMKPPSRTYRRRGCHRCRNRGTVGKTAIYEVFYPDRELREKIQTGVSVSHLRDAWTASGGVSMVENGLQLVAAGRVEWESIKVYEPRPIRRPPGPINGEGGDRKVPAISSQQ